MATPDRMKLKRAYALLAPEDRPEVFGAIENVWGQLASDAECEGPIRRNAIAVEICIDADRLTTFGFPKADELVKKLIKEHGYENAFRYLCRNVRLV